MFRLKVFCAAILLGTMAAAQANNHRLQLDDVVREALDHNPAIASAVHATAARRPAVPLAKSLPDPVLSAGWMGKATPFTTMAGDPSSYRALSLMQPLPWPGKRALTATVAQKEVAIADVDRERVERQVVANVKEAFYNYFYYEKALEITRTNKQHLDQYEQISNARYRVGKAMQQDVLRAQAEVSILLQRLVTFQEQRDVAAAKLNMLMGRAADSPLPPAAEPPREPLPEMSALLPLAGSSPDVVREQRSVERDQARENLADKEYRPDIGVGFMYQQRPNMPDMYGATVSVSIPIFYGKKRDEALAEARENTLAAEKSRENQLNDTRFELKQAYFAAHAAEQMADLYKQAVLPQTSLALQSSEASYQVGKVDFLTMLTNFTTLNSYQIDYYRQLADYEIALARIEEIVGQPPIASRPSSASPEGER